VATTNVLRRLTVATVVAAALAFVLAVAPYPT
jgi:hypothetical protein